MMPEDYYEEYEQTIAEQKATIELLRKTLEFAREGLSTIPASLGYKITHIKRIDDTLKRTSAEVEK
jgi:hypothetical protein